MAHTPEKCVPTLIEAGAVVNVTAEFKSPLDMCSRSRNQTKVVDYLIRAGADVNHHTDNMGMTAVYAAARHGHAECVSRLVKAGAECEQEL